MIQLFQCQGRDTMNNLKRNIVALTGPSGVGKGYVKKLIKESADIEIFEPVVVTTRKRRDDDNSSRRTDLTIQEFETEVQLGKILFPHRPFEENNTPLYGFDNVDLNKQNILTEIHPVIFTEFKQHFCKDNLLVIGILANQEYLLHSILNRGSKTNDLEIRLEKSSIENKKIYNAYKKRIVDKIFTISLNNRDLIQKKIVTIAKDWFHHERQ